MSVYKRKGSPHFQFDSWVKGHRVRGTAETTNRREAKKIEDAAREAKRRELASGKKAPGASMQFHEVTALYNDQVAKHLVGQGADIVFRDLERLEYYFGKNKLITEITDADVAKLVSWRRGQQVVRLRRIKGKKDLQQDPRAPLVKPATVNRSTTELLKKLFMRARDTWGVKFDEWPRWKTHILKEPDERVRELNGGEGEAIMGATRDDYAPAIEFEHATGWRQGSVVTLEWTQVDWDNKAITRTGKGGKIITTEINTELRAILWPLVGHHPTRVFTYIAQKTRDDRVAGQRYPITSSGFKTAWRRARAKAGLGSGVNRLRNHDLRHDFATKLLRSNRDLKLVQRAMGHANITTTMRYAHVLDEDVHSAVAEQAKNRIRKEPGKSPHKIPRNDVGKSQKPLRHSAKSH
jgi:integrase